jgi:hypothetical protein
MAKAKAVKKSAPKSNSTLSAFKSLHDPTVIIPAKIKAALAKLAKEDVAFAYEASDPRGGLAMTKRANVSTIHLAQYREQFAGHIVKVAADTGSKRAARLVWFGDAAVAKEARGGVDANPADFE